jgi:hypothetical protein
MKYEVIDSTFKYGAVGFYSNLSTASFTGMDVKQLDCTADKKPGVFLEPVETNVFRERYNEIFSEVYNVFDCSDPDVTILT